MILKLRTYFIHIPWITTFACCLLFLCNACIEEKDHFPPGLTKPNIDEQTEIKVLSDIHIAEAIIGKQNKKADKKYSRKSLFSFIYKKYDVDKAIVDSLINYYIYHPDEYEAIYTKVKDHINGIELLDSLPKIDTLSLAYLDSIALIDSIALADSIALVDSLALEEARLDSIEKLDSLGVAQ